MNEHEIGILIEFNFWANARILAASELLSPDAFRLELQPDPGWGDLRSLLVHILDTEYGWRSVLQSLDADDILEAADFADVAVLKARWEKERAAWLRYATSLNTVNLDQSAGGQSPTGLKVWQTILHVVCHGIQHRSEAAMILTGYGQSPGELDFDTFLREKARHDQV